MNFDTSVLLLALFLSLNKVDGHFAKGNVLDIFEDLKKVDGLENILLKSFAGPSIPSFLRGHAANDISMNIPQDLLAKIPIEYLEDQRPLSNVSESLGEHLPWGWEFFFKTLFKFYLPRPEHHKNETLGGINDQCQEDVRQIYYGLYSNHSWAIQLVDSWGKPPSGIFEGNFNWMGVFDECLAVKNTTGDLNVHGQYCRVEAKLPSLLPAALPSLWYSSCIPDSCYDYEFKESLTNAFRDLAINGSVEVSCQTDDYYSEWGPWEYAGSIIIGILVVIVAVASAVDLLIPARIPAVIKCFSAPENLSKIFAVRTAGAGEISCFHAIRVFSITWVVLGHQMAYAQTSANNYLHIVKMTEYWGYQIVWNAFRAVDTFFLLGGLLVSKALLSVNLLLTRQNDNAFRNEVATTSKEKRLWILVRKQGFLTTALVFTQKYFIMLVHRIIRILPTMFIVIMFIAGPSTLLANGPFRKQYVDTIEGCRDYIWWDILFLYNFLYKRAQHAGEPGGSCIGSTWYVDVDMQLYLVMPFLLLPMKFIKHKQTYLWFWILISCLIPGLLTAVDGELPGIIINNQEKQAAYFVDVYVMPYTRATPYLVGCLCGYWLSLYQDSKKTGKEILGQLYEKHPNLRAAGVRTIGWLLATVTAMAVVFGLVGINYANSPNDMSDLGKFFYASLDILAWSLFVAWVVMICAMGLAEPLNYFLSHAMWQPLSRLSFGVYLVSLPVQKLLFLSQPTTTYVTYTLEFLLSLGVTTVFFLSALLLSVLAEAPFINLLKMMR